MAILNRNEGVLASTPEQAQQLEAAGYLHCYGKTRKGLPCPFYISPETIAWLKNGGGYYTCPVCAMSFDLLEDLEWHGAQGGNYELGTGKAGGGTRIGLDMKEQAQIGEDLVEQMGEIPGYGKITWWHQGGAVAQSPLDGTTEEWGVEVKTIGYDARHHRFVPGGKRTREDGTVFDEKLEKNEAAAQLGLKGVLGVLVLLDYRRSLADIFVKAMPLDGWLDGQGKMRKGVAAFRSNTGYHLVKEVPFANPLMDPQHPAPHAPNSKSAFADEAPAFDDSHLDSVPY